MTKKMKTLMSRDNDSHEDNESYEVALNAYNAEDMNVVP